MAVTTKTVCQLFVFVPGLLLWWASASVAIIIAEVTAYLPPRSAFPLSFFGLINVFLKLIMYQIPSQLEVHKDFHKRKATPLDLISNLIMLIFMALTVTVMLCRRARFLLKWMYVSGVLYAAMNICLHIVIANDIGLHIFNIISFLIVGLFGVLIIIEYECGLYWPGLPGMTRCVRRRPVEALFAVTAWARTQILVITPIECILFYNPKSQLILCIVVLLILSCPLTYKSIAFNSAWWGGNSWQGFLLPILAVMPWAPGDHRLEMCCRKGIHYGVAGLLAEIPLEQGYDGQDTARLQLIMSWMGGRSFSVTSVRYYIECNADPNATDEDGRTCLSLAVKNDDVALVQYLVGLKAVRARITQADENERSALHYAQSDRVVHLLLAAGSDPNQVDKDGRTPLMNITNEEKKKNKILNTRSKDVRAALGWRADGSGWNEMKEKLPWVHTRSQLYDKLWNEELSLEVRRERQQTIVDECILKLLEQNQIAPLSRMKSDSLYVALRATKCPQMFACELDAETMHFRGGNYNRALQQSMRCFEAELQAAKEELQNDPVGSAVFKFGSGYEKLHATSPSLRPWPDGMKLSQVVAEDLPEWLSTQNLREAIKALAEVDIITSISELSDLFNGQHRLFDGNAYSHYFSNGKSDIFWIALYVLYDIGKTMQISDDFQQGLRMAIDAPQEVKFLGAPVKSFKRIMEKIEEDLISLEKSHPNPPIEMKYRCAAEVKDKARNSFICDTGSQLWDLNLRFTSLDGQNPVVVRPGVCLRFTSIARKSGFSKPAAGGYADIKFYVLVERLFYDDGISDKPRIEIALVSETQVILSRYLDVKNRMHVVYEAVRGDFDLSEMDQERALAHFSDRVPVNSINKVVPISVDQSSGKMEPV